MSDLTAEIDRIASVTQFNGTFVLSSTATISFQIGTDNSANDRINVTGVQANQTGIGITGLSVSTITNAQSALTILDNAISNVASLRAGFGTVQNRLESAIRSIAVARENTTAAESRIRDVDFASETAQLTKNQVLQQAGISVLAQANVSTQSALSLLG